MTSKDKTVLDTLAPTLIKSSPSINNAPSNTNIVFTFNEKIKLDTGLVTIESSSDKRTMSITDKQVKISGTTLTINPTVDLNIGSTYKVHLDAGAIKDLAPVSNSAVAIDFSFTTKATGDKQAPVLQNYLGKGTASDNLQLTFQESIKIGKGSFTLVNNTDPTDKIVIDVSKASVANNVLTIVPTQNLKPETTYLLTAPKGIVTDLAKNAFAGITAKAPFTFDTHDKTPPTLTITDDKTATTNSAILYTFTATEAIKSFTVDDITVTGGTSAATLTTVSPTIYTLSVTPAANSTTPITINVAAGKFTDLVNNVNLATATSTQTVDTVAPTVTIKSDKAGVANSPILYTFTLSEASNTFVLDDINVTGGEKAAALKTVSTTVYTLIVTPDVSSTTPVKVDVAAGKFNDIAGNNNVAATQSIQEVNTVSPTITITSDKTAATNTTILYTFKLSTESPDFTIDDITITGGSNSSILTAISPNIYTLSVTPNANSTLPITVDVAAGKFTNMLGNSNLTALQNIQPIDTVPPQIVITDNQINTVKNGDILYTFTLNEPSTNFTLDDITVIGGIKAIELIPLSSTVYTLSVTPKTNSTESITVDVASGKFTDATDNGNVAAVQNIQAINTVPIIGKAVDGYLSGSDVFADNNGNGVWDEGEAKAVTDAEGNFKLPSGSAGTIIVSGGTDLTTGKAFKGVLKAPEGSTTVTPLTTIQQGFITSGQTPEEAQASVAKAFGFSNTVDLTQYDPIAALMNSSNASATDKKQATDLMANVAKIANFLVTASETLKGAGGDKVTAANAGDAILKSLVNSLSSAGSTGVIDLSNASLLTTVLTDSAKEVAKTVTGTTGNFETKITTMAATVASVIKDATDNITAVVATGGSSDALLSSMGNVSKFTQEGSASKLQEIAKTFNPSNSNALKDLSALATTLTGDAADSAIKKGSSIPDPVTPIKPITPTPVPPPTPVTPVIPVTPTTDITVSNSGNTDASTAKTKFNFLTGNYIYSIANFSADDSLIFPMGQTITIKNEDLTDKKVELHWASKGNEMTVILTGLTAAQDKALLFESDVSKQFGSTALIYKTSAPTPSNTAQNITISTDGSQNATTGNIAFNILAGDYNFTIADFSTGDSLHFPVGHKPSVLNTSFIDGKVDVHWTSVDGQDAVITLTGLTDIQDKALLFTSSFNTLFGLNTLS